MTTMTLCTLFAASLFVGTVLCLRLGWRLGRRHFAVHGEDGHAGLGAVEGGVFGLMGLLIAFTFTGAAERFDRRRQMIVEHVNAIDVAWRRLDLLGDRPRVALHELFRRYVDAQLELPRNAADSKRTAERFAAITSLQERIWTEAVAAARADPAQPIALVLLPAINRMFDLMQSRWLSTRQHPPTAIYLMLALLVLISSLMAGFGMAKAKRQSRLHVLGFSGVLAVSIYLILDLEHPRFGFVRIDDFDRAFAELRVTFH